MGLIAVGAWRGVGASTAAHLLAAASALDPGHRDRPPPVLVEADPAGGVLALRAPALHHRAGATSRLGFARPDQPDDLGSHVVALADIEVLTGSEDSFAAWSAIASPRTIERVLDAAASGRTVIADVGSLRDGRSPARALIDAADDVVLIANPEPASLVSAVDWCEASGRTSPDASSVDRRPVIIVIDTPAIGTERFEQRRTTDELGDRLLGWWPWEPAVVARLLRGASLDHRSVRRSSLAAAAVATAARLRSEVVR